MHQNHQYSYQYTLMTKATSFFSFWGFRVGRKQLGSPFFATQEGLLYFLTFACYKCPGLPNVQATSGLWMATEMRTIAWPPKPSLWGVCQALFRTVRSMLTLQHKSRVPDNSFSRFSSNISVLPPPKMDHQPQ